MAGHTLRLKLPRRLKAATGRLPVALDTASRLLFGDALTAVAASPGDLPRFLDVCRRGEEPAAVPARLAVVFGDLAVLTAALSPCSGSVLKLFAVNP